MESNSRALESEIVCLNTIVRVVMCNSLSQGRWLRYYSYYYYHYYYYYYKY